MKPHRIITSLALVIFLCLSVYVYWYIRWHIGEQERNLIGEVVLRDAMARFARLAPPKPGEQYVIYETPSDPVNANLIHQLRDVVPHVITSGDPEFINGPNNHSFLIGNIERDKLGNVNLWVNTNVRGNPTKANGITDYTLIYSGGRWMITGRKFTGKTT